MLMRYANAGNDVPTAATPRDLQGRALHMTLLCVTLCAASTEIQYTECLLLNAYRTRGAAIDAHETPGGVALWLVLGTMRRNTERP